MALIKRANLSDLSSEAIVLDLGDLARQGDAILSRAKARAEQLLRDAEAERVRLISGAAEEGRAAGFAQGIEEGRREGVKQGEATALAERREALAVLEQRWIELLESFSADRDRLVGDARRDVLTLACRIARMVTHRAIACDPAIVADQVGAVLELVMRPSRVMLGVHPADRVLVEAALPGLSKRFANATHIEIMDREDVARGSCVAALVDAGPGGTPGGDVDASIDAQLDRIVSALLPRGQAVEPSE
jgi:flagellar assembly protein FliH